MFSELRGRTALITGAARRIGRETARALAEQGVNLVLHFNRSDGEAQRLAEQLERLGVRTWPVQADFRRPEEYGTLIERARELAGALDILINNASIFPAERLDALTWPELSANVEVNAWVPLVLSRRFAAGLDARGSIINLHDTHLASFDFEHSGYILSKHMLATLTRMLALELAPNITVNAVAPGLILPPPGADESYLTTHARRLPLQRHGGPRDIAEAIVFLVRSDFITGQVIYVDGGRHLQGYTR
ncbi:MAG TPA: SDR family oxidoreductase [Steroidobacteraceae bacterium]|nr:SDR family oxidoreductase [Steroidobacteraceae bacterium]